MSKRGLDVEDYVERTAAALELPLDSRDLAEVVVAFRRIAEMAEFVMEFPVGDEVDPAPSFLP